jgi:hypothetical protein
MKPARQDQIPQVGIIRGNRIGMEVTGFLAKFVDGLICVLPKNPETKHLDAGS